MRQQLLSTSRNRLLAALSPSDRTLLEPMMERIPLALHTVLIEANEPIRHLVFPESGIVSTLAIAEGERIEIGMIGEMASLGFL